MTPAAAIAINDSDDTASLLTELLDIRQQLLSKAVTALLLVRKTPAAFPLALECRVICSLSCTDVARKLELPASSLESMLRIESPNPDLEDDFVDAVLTLLVEEAPYQLRGKTALHE